MPTYEGGIVLCVKMAVKMQNLAQASAGARLSMVELMAQLRSIIKIAAIELTIVSCDHHRPIIRED